MKFVLNIAASRERRVKRGDRIFSLSARFSVLDALATLVEVFQEAALIRVFDIVAVRETLVPCVRSLSDWADLV